MGIFTHSCSPPLPAWNSRTWTCSCGNVLFIERLRPVEQTVLGAGKATYRVVGKKR